MNNDTEVSIKFKNSVTGENKLKAYAETLSKIQSVLSGMNEGRIKQIEQSGNALKSVNNETDKIAKKMNLAFDYTVVRKFASSLTSAYQSLIRVTQKSSEFLESFNLFQVAFNGNYISAEKFMNKMTEMYGLDESWAIRTIGLFKQLANAMGLTADVGDRLSTLLTQMSVDISSLYNLDVDKVPQILQSALAGQTKPARRLGADITQATLQQTLGGLGIDREVANLSYAEKRLLIVISLTKQLTQVTGDWGRTLESPANQMRILSEQFNRFSREVGNVFLPILSKILPYLNAILMVLTEIIASIARLLGYNKEDYDYFGTMAEDIDDFGEGVGVAADNVDKLKRGLRGFDKLNNITTPTSASGGAGGGVGTGIDANLLDAFNKAYDDYYKKLDNVQMKATKIRDTVLEWLGFTKEIDPITGDVSFRYNGISKTLSNMWKSFKGMTPSGKALTVIIGYLFGKTIISGATKLLKLLGKTGLFGAIKNLLTPMKQLWQSLDKINFAETSLTKGVTKSIDAWSKNLSLLDRAKITLVGAGGLIAGYSLLTNAIKSAEEEGWKLSNVLGAVGGALSNIMGGAMIGSQFGTMGLIIGGVAGAFVSLVEAMNATETETDKLIAKSQEHSKAILEYAQSVENTYTQIDESVKKSVAVHQNNENLFNELKTLVDENGNILTGYEDRVKFILNELQNAYGIEYSIVGNQIQQYEKYTKSIKDLIYQKKIEAILSGRTEAYTVAIGQRDELIDKYNEQKSIVESLNTEISKENKHMEKLVKQYVDGKISQLEYSTGIENSSRKIADLNEELDKAKTKQDTFKDTVVKNEKIISDYSTLMEAQISGDMEKIESAITETTGSYVKNGEIVSNDIQKRIERLNTLFNDLHSITEEEYNSQMNALANTLVTMSKDLDTMTPEIVDGWASLASSSTEKFMEYFNKVPKELQQNVIDKMQDKGYKISDELQKGINKLNPTITFNANTKNVETSIQGLGGKIFNLLGLGNLFKANGGVLVNGKWQPVNYYDSGGLPPVGQMFVARERGPELVGNIGSHTAVMNNDQIVSSVAYGVEGAVSRAMRNANQGKQIYNIYLDQDHKIGTYTLEQLQEMAKSNGKPLNIY